MEKLLDNSSRGKTSITWLKVTFFISLFAVILGYIALGFLPDPVGEGDLPNVSGFLIAMVVAVVLAAIACSITGMVASIYWIFWLFRCAENTRKMQPDSMSPWFAVIISFIFGQLGHYFVFRKLIARMKNELESRNIPYKPVFMRNLNLFLVLAIVGAILGALGSLKVVGFTGVVEFSGVILGLVSVACYINVLMGFVAQEELLFKNQEDAIFRQKVDKALEDRENERRFVEAASEVQEATYKSEPKSQG